MNFSKVQEYVNAMRREAKNKTLAFVIGSTRRKSKERIVLLPLRDTSYAFCGGVIVYAADDAVRIAEMVDARVDVILLDVEQKVRKMNGAAERISARLHKSKMLTFKGNDMTADAMDALLASTMGSLYRKKIAIIGAGNLGSKVALKLVERGAIVAVTRRKIGHARNVANAINHIKTKHAKGKAIAAQNLAAARNAYAILGFTQGIPAVTAEMVAVMRRGGIVVDGGVGTIRPDAIKEAYRRGIEVLRLDVRAGFIGAVATLFETEKLLRDVMGTRKIRGINVVAGGVIGSLGDVIVDNIRRPKHVFGIADGKGGVLTGKLAKKYGRKIKFIKTQINIKPTRA